MWLFSDPVECQIAEQYLKHNQLLEAARILLSPRLREHKAVRELLLRIAPQLVEQARQTLYTGDLLVTAELLNCASQCAGLPPEVQILRDRVEQQLSQQRQQRDWHEQRLFQADRWAKEGRLYSALGMIEPLADDPLVARRKLEWQQAVDRLDRYAAEVRQHLENGKMPAAYAVLCKARELAPGQPLVLCLEQELRAAQRGDKIESSSPMQEPATAAAESIGKPKSGKKSRSSSVNLSTSRLLLSGLSEGGDVLLLSQPVVTIGSPIETHVDLPIQAMLRRRHAVIIREDVTGPNGETHRLMPLAGAIVSVNGKVIPVGVAIWLAHNDQLHFGLETCRWTYHRRLMQSATAILEQSQPNGAVAVTPAGTPIRRVVLLGDELRIGRNANRNHVFEPSFPAYRLKLTMLGGHWRAAVDDGELIVNDGEESDEGARPLRIPAELVLHHTNSLRMFAGAVQASMDVFEHCLRLTHV